MLQRRSYYIEEELLEASVLERGLIREAGLLHNGLLAMRLINMGLIGRRLIRDGAYNGGGLFERVRLFRGVSFERNVGLPRSVTR